MKIKSWLWLTGSVLVALVICVLLFPCNRSPNTESNYVEAISAIGALNTKIKVYQIDHGQLPGCGLNHRNSYYDPQSNLSARCLTQRLVNSPIDIFGLDENGDAVSGFINMGPFQMDLGIAYNDYEGKFFGNCNYQYRVIKAGYDTNCYAYVLVAIGDGRHVEAGTGYAIFTRFNPAETDKERQLIVATWARYRPECTNMLVLTDRPSKPWHIPVPTFDMSVEKIRKLGWTVD